MAKPTAPLAEYAPEVKREPVVLTVKGKPVAPLVSIKNADWETATLRACQEITLTHSMFHDKLLV
jgi:prevent-host-death family protein